LPEQVALHRKAELTAKNMTKPTFGQMKEGGYLLRRKSRFRRVGLLFEYLQSEGEPFFDGRRKMDAWQKDGEDLSDHV